MSHLNSIFCSCEPISKTSRFPLPHEKVMHNKHELHELMTSTSVLIGVPVHVLDGVVGVNGAAFLHCVQQLGAHHLL